MRDSRQNTNIFTFITMYDQFKIPDNIRYQYVLLLSYNTWTITLISTSLCDQYKYYYGSTAAAVILRRMGKNKAQALTIPRIRCMSCFVSSVYHPAGDPVKTCGLIPRRILHNNLLNDSHLILWLYISVSYASLFLSHSLEIFVWRYLFYSRLVSVGHDTVKYTAHSLREL